MRIPNKAELGFLLFSLAAVLLVMREPVAEEKVKKPDEVAVVNTVTVSQPVEIAGGETPVPVVGVPGRPLDVSGSTVNINGAFVINSPVPAETAVHGELEIICANTGGTPSSGCALAGCDISAYDRDLDDGALVACYGGSNICSLDSPNCTLASPLPGFRLVVDQLTIARGSQIRDTTRVMIRASVDSVVADHSFSAAAGAQSWRTQFYSDSDLTIDLKNAYPLESPSASGVRITFAGHLVPVP